MSRTVEELKADHAALVDERADLQDRIDAYRADHPRAEPYLTDGDGIPNTMEYERVTLEAKIDCAFHALNEAIASSGGLVEETSPTDEPSTDGPPASEE